jgi:prephenate dehydrogenase
LAVVRKAAVIGVGLIGGSFALALKAAGIVQHVVGVGRERHNLEQALARGVIDEVQHDVSTAVRDAELIFIATPVGAMADIFARMAPVLRDDALILDGGSTKRSVIDAARAALGTRIAQFVPAHPIAGSEKSGAVAATSQLFRDREVVITPLAENKPADIARVQALWSQCGARVTEMEPERHDRIMAAISHAPHFIAFAYVHGIARSGEAAELLAHAGAGFRDFTRLASSHPRMWSDICTANRTALLAELARFETALAELRALVESGEGAQLADRFTNARALRDAWAASSPVTPGEGE